MSSRPAVADPLAPESMSRLSTAPARALPSWRACFRPCGRVQGSTGTGRMTRRSMSLRGRSPSPWTGWTTSARRVLGLHAQGRQPRVLQPLCRTRPHPARGDTGCPASGRSAVPTGAGRTNRGGLEHGAVDPAAVAALYARYDSELVEG